MDVLVGRCLKHNMVFRRQRKRDEVAVGAGPKDCKAGYETNNFSFLEQDLK